MARITLEFLQKIISTTESDVIVTSFQETHGSGRGDNYTAMLYRLKLEGHRFSKDNKTKEPWRKSLIYKCLPDNYARREAFKSDTLFKNEVAFYTTVMPVLLKYQLSKGSLIKEKFRSIPHCYYARSALLVLEDMCVTGFKMADRKLGLNYEQCKAVLKELAKFHGLSLAFKIEHPDKLKSLLENKNSIQESYFIKENAQWYRSYYTAVRHNAFAMVQEALSNNKNNEKYLQKFSHFIDDLFYFRMMSLVKPVEPLAVFCHGDCWTNNIMFSTSDKIDHVCLVDFQLCRYASPALDLANLIYCCTTRQLRDQKLDLLITVYFETIYNFLQDILNDEAKLNCEFLQKEKFRSMIDNDFKRCGLFGLGLALDMIPISTCDSNQAPDLYDEDHEENRLDETGAFPVESNETCKRKMVNLVCELVDREVL